MFLFEKKDSNSFTGKREGAMFVKYVKYLCAFFVFASFLLLGCEESKDENPSLHGTWESEWGEVWIINLNNNTLDAPAFPDMAYKGNISEIVYFNSNGTAGIIFIELTDVGASFSFSGESTAVGNFTGVHFTKLTDTTAEIAAASDEDAGFATPVKKTLAQAEQLLNVDSVQTYFAMTSACVKQ